jgi:hypothetical protein
MLMECALALGLAGGGAWQWWRRRPPPTLTVELSLCPQRTHETIRCLLGLLADPEPEPERQMASLRQALRAAAHPDHGADQLLPRLEHMLRQVGRSAALRRRLERLEPRLPPEDRQLQWCFTVILSMLSYIEA